MDHYEEQRRIRLQLAYEVGALKGFIQYGLYATPSVVVKDQAAFEAAIEAAFARIAKDAEEWVKKA